MKEFTEKFKALADETRLRILNLLINSNSELCVCELTDALEIPQYNISRHLKIIRNAGLIEERKEGRWVYFGLAKGNDAFTETIFDSIKRISATQLSKDLVELDKRFAIRTGGKCLLGIQKKHLMGSHVQREPIK
ncbi:MAG: winged helix-turn-helix transcriptional regulator [Candidatus Marinimicrobia bacterium]|nr:winged helix-turn-helix transcriptional regulator [Candidatus Neomarinimicrobiota bacterium]